MNRQQVPVEVIAEGSDSLQRIGDLRELTRQLEQNPIASRVLKTHHLQKAQR